MLVPSCDSLCVVRGFLPGPGVGPERLGPGGPAGAAYRSAGAPDRLMLAGALWSAWADLSGQLQLFEVPGGQHPRAFGLDGDRRLEVGGQRPILGVDGPVVVAHPDPVLAGRDHRLDAEDHT